MSVLPTESNISMVGVGLIGRTASGAGKSSRLSAASVRSLCSVYSTSEVDTLLSGKANSSHTHSQSDVTGLVSALAAKADLVGGLVPSSQLPSYVDDVIEGANLAAFPGTGETGKIYVALDTGRTYRWSGSAYVELTDATAVWGSISGTLSNQTDLQSALTARALTTTTISAGTGLSGGGDLSASRSLAVVYGTTSGTACEGNDSRLSDARTPTAHNQAWSTITSTPTTLAGYGITDAQPLDSDLTAIAALTTTAFGRSVLTQADGPAIRTLIGAGTSSFDGAYASLSGIPSSFTPSSHTHTAANITDFGEAVDDEVATLLQAGSGITLTYNDVANTLTIAASGGGGSPGGSSGQVQFNNAGAFGGAAAMVYAATGQHLVVTAQAATTVPIRAKGAASHSGNLLEAVNSADSLLFYVQSNGAIVSANNLTVATQLTMNDTAIRRISAGILEVNNGTAGQKRDVELRSLGVTANIYTYGTYTSSTSFEALLIKSTLTQVEIGQQRGSAGGSDRPIVLGHYGSGSTINAAITIATDDVVKIGPLSHVLAEVTITDAAVAMVSNRRYVGSIAAFTADRNYTLPAGTAGDVIEVQITTGDDLYELILLGASGVSINGGTAATEWSRLFISNEFVRFRCIATNDWRVEIDGRINSRWNGYLAATVNNHYPDDTVTKVPLDTVGWNVGDIGSISTDQVTIRRTGYYDISGGGYVSTLTLNTVQVIGFISINGTLYRGSWVTRATSGVSGAGVFGALNGFLLSAGDVVFFALYQNDFGTRNAEAASRLTNLTVTECL